MMLKIGELAKRCGMTVRALHHYDAIGLFGPSARSDAGYRLYNRDDIARLHQIQALRRFGVALSDIGTFLDGAGSNLSAILDQQIDALTRQIAQAGDLRGQLVRLQDQLRAGQEPELSNWLTTLELMTMYDKYFTQDELERLPFHANPACIAEWDALIVDVRKAMDSGVAPTDRRAQTLAEHWMIMLERDSGGNPDFVVRLNNMQLHDPTVRERNGITPEIESYVQEAFAAWRMAIYRPYLSESEFAFLSANYGKRTMEWPPLIARIRNLIEAGTAPASPEGRAAAHQWMELFTSYAGTDPSTHMKFRQAHQEQPSLMTGTFVTPEVLAFVMQGASAQVG